MVKVASVITTSLLALCPVDFEKVPEGERARLFLPVPVTDGVVWVISAMERLVEFTGRVVASCVSNGVVSGAMSPSGGVFLVPEDGFTDAGVIVSETAGEDIALKK